MSFRYIVIDDAPFITEVIKNILKGTSAHFVGEAGNGVEGLHLFAKTRPELVILDMVMPGENGIETARKIREISQEAVLIACSTLDDAAIVENATDVGCNDYISKPFTKEGFLNVVKKHFQLELENMK